jgi:hypothetical protein
MLRISSRVTRDADREVILPPGSYLLPSLTHLLAGLALAAIPAAALAQEAQAPTAVASTVFLILEMSDPTRACSTCRTKLSAN